ncbi:MAG: hypothetical protein AAB209_07760 [Bacteroidota bacterium]
MKRKSVHEPRARLMSADDVRADAEELVEVLRAKPSKNESVVRLQIPFSTLLSAVDQLRRHELALLQKRVGERLR